MISWGEGKSFHHNKFGRKEQYYKSIFLRLFESYGKNIKQANLRLSMMLDCILMAAGFPI